MLKNAILGSSKSGSKSAFSGSKGLTKLWAAKMLKNIIKIKIPKSVHERAQEWSF
jgi:hypothetical protein